MDDIADKLAEALEGIEEQARHRMGDGDEIGARVWRIALEDIARDARATLAEYRAQKGGG